MVYLGGELYFGIPFMYTHLTNYGQLLRVQAIARTLSAAASVLFCSRAC